MDETKEEMVPVTKREIQEMCGPVAVTKLPGMSTGAKVAIAASVTVAVAATAVAGVLLYKKYKGSSPEEVIEE